jgi:arabinogalactan oligomer / maltooligosaccharide transport system substrate-binding protein
VEPPSDDRWTRVRSRRDVLQLGVAVVAGGTAASLLASCAAQSGGGVASVTPTEGRSLGPIVAPTTASLSGRITVLMGGDDPGTEPALQAVYDDFQARNPAIEWDIRALPVIGPEWDRLARAALVSGEPVGLVVIDGLFVRAWARDGLLADLGADSRLADVLARIPDRFHLAGPGETTTRAFPLALSRGIQTTGLYYNKALLDRAGLEAPRTIVDLKAMVKPLAALGAAPLVYCSGDVPFNPLLVMWLLPMIAGRAGDPVAFVERTIKGDIGYDSPEWLETFQAIADLRASGVLLEGSGAIDYATMQLLLLQGKAATSYNGTWLLPQLQAGTATVPFDLHVAPLPLVEGAERARSILAWGGFAIPAGANPSIDAVEAFLEFASRPEVDVAVVEGLQSYSPIEQSNSAIHDLVAREFLPMLSDAITPLNWLWEPEIDTEIGNQVQALVKGDTDAASVGRAIEAVADDLRSSGRSYYS